MSLTRDEDVQLDKLYGEYTSAMNKASKILQKIRDLEANRDTVVYE